MTRVAIVEYGVEDWKASAGHHPLAALSSSELERFARVWLYADLQRQAADRMEARLDNQAASVERENIEMAAEALESLWLAFLASLAESRYGAAKERLMLRGALREDLAAIWTTLRDARKAAFSAELDQPERPQLSDDTITRARRIHQGFQRLLAEEIARRQPRA